MAKYKNYNKMHKPTTEVTESTEKDIDRTIVESVPEPVEDPKPTTGRVTDCLRLNIRVAPNIKSDVVDVVFTNTILTLDVSESTDEWYKVCTKDGIEGYCMKQYINAIYTF